MTRSDTAELPILPFGARVAVRLHPRPGADACGDAAAAWRSGRRRVLCIAGGLGSGPEAARASTLAVRYVGAHLDADVPALLGGCDAALRDSPGAAVGIAIVEADRLTYGGVGSTRGLRAGVSSCRFSSDAGTVGAGFRRLLVEAVPIERGDLVVLFTDGLSERLCVPEPATLGLVDPDRLAGELLGTWATGQDDAAVLVYQHLDDP